MIQALREHLDQKLVWNAHVKAKATEAPVVLPQAVSERRWPMFCHDMPDVVSAPGVVELAAATHGLAAEYFAEPPLLYSVNAFWTQPAAGPEYRDTHSWHRDGDDRKQLVIFVYGTDVLAASDGAHLYQKGTHSTPDNALGRDFRAPPPEVVMALIGKAGSTFAADTWGVHMGLRPGSGPRMLAWVRWGVSDPPQSYLWDGLKPVPKSLLGDRYPQDPELQRAFKLVVS